MGQMTDQTARAICHRAAEIVEQGRVEGFNKAISVAARELGMGVDRIIEAEWALCPIVESASPSALRRWMNAKCRTPAQVAFALRSV